MLKELENLDDPGGKGNLLYFLLNILGDKMILQDDVKLLCSHAVAGYRMDPSALLAYCESFGWISIDKYVAIERSLLKFLWDESALNEELVNRTVKLLFEYDIFKSDIFSFNVEECRIMFHNERFPLQFSSIRNTLISQGFLITEQRDYAENFYVNNIFEKIISQYLKQADQKITLNQLKEKIEKDAIAGEKAEAYALSYERQRLATPFQKEKVRLVSDVDVSAGYDMVSFETDQSLWYDRFVEVKAVSKTGFYWSNNEYEVAKFKGDHYYLYLVDLSKIKNVDYVPMIIQDPANNIMRSDDWFVEAQSYHIRKL